MCRPRLCYHISTIFYTSIESYSTEQLQFGLYITVLTLELSSSSLFFTHLKPIHLLKSNSRIQVIPKYTSRFEVLDKYQLSRVPLDHWSAFLLIPALLIIHCMVLVLVMCILFEIPFFIEKQIVVFSSFQSLSLLLINTVTAKLTVWVLNTTISPSCITGRKRSPETVSLQ